jgi:hypothetical protein
LILLRAISDKGLRLKAGQSVRESAALSRLKQQAPQIQTEIPKAVPPTQAEQLLGFEFSMPTDSGTKTAFAATGDRLALTFLQRCLKVAILFHIGKDLSFGHLTLKPPQGRFDPFVLSQNDLGHG